MWLAQLKVIPASGAIDAVNALTADDCLGDVGLDSNFDAHLAAGQAAAVAALAGLTGAATLRDVTIQCVPDASRQVAGTLDRGCQISVTVVERY